MCMCLRGKQGRFCCCSTLIGMHMTGPISIGLFCFYMTMFIKSSHADKFNWVILIWTFAIGLPRVLGYFMLFCDSLKNRKIYCMILVVTLLLEILIYATNQIMIFTDDKGYCNRAYPVYYMVTEWDIYCDWAVSLFEIGLTGSIFFYIAATMAAYDHYHLGFLCLKLKAIETNRLFVME